MYKLTGLLAKRVVFLRTIATFPAFSASAKLLWGLLLVNPYVDTFESSQSYSAMAHLFFWVNTQTSELLWGLTLIVMSLCHLYTIVGKYSKARFVCDHISMGFWLFIGAVFFFANKSGLGPYFYWFIGIYEFIYSRREVDKWLQE